MLRKHAPDYKLLMSLMPHKTHAALACRHQRNLNADNPTRAKRKESTKRAHVTTREWKRKQRHIKKTQLPCPENNRGVVIPVTNCVARAISSVVQAAKARDYSKEFARNTRPRINQLARNRRVNDPAYRAERNLRSRFADYARTHGFIKGASTEEMLQCSWVEFEARMSSMDADHANCEYDHIFPMSSYDLHLKENQLRCMHHTNIQPLTRKENRSKSNRLPTKAMAARVGRSFWPDGVTEDMLPDIYPGWSTPLRM